MVSPVTVLRDSDIDRMSAGAPVLRDSDIEAHEQQPSAAARFFMPFVKMAADAVHYVKNPADAGPVALHLLKLAAEAAIPGYGPQVVGGEIAHGLADPIVHAVKSGDYAGAAGQATLDALMAAAPEAGELGEAAGSAAEMARTAIKGGIKEGMTPIRYGRLNIPVPSSVAGAAAAGYAGHYLGLPAELSAAVGAVAPVVRGGVRAVRAAMAERAAAEAASEAGFGVASGTTALPTRAASVSPGIVPEAGGLLPGMREELEARIASQQPPGFGVAGGSTAAPTRGVPMTPGVIPDVAGALPGAPVAASTPVAAAPVSASPAVSMPSAVDSLRAELEAAHAPPAAAPSVESLRVDLEASLRDGIARANGFKKGFEAIPTDNPARQNIQATAAAIARAEQGAPEVSAAPVSAPSPAAAPPVAATEAPVSGAPTPPPTMEMPRFQVQPTPDEASISTPRSYASARSHPDVTAATAYETPVVSPVPRQPQFDTFHSPYNANGDYMSANARALQIEQWNVANKGMRLAQAMDKAGITLADVQKATPEQWQFIEKTLKQKGLIDSEQVIDGKVIPGETVPEEAIPSIINNLWKIQEAKKALGISGSEPTGIGGLMRKKP